jgi:flavin-dependent dehydrogenase
MYDVIVIGAGVTGSIASQQLSSMGYNVLLIEKAKMPREKSCSGILIKKSMDFIQTYIKSEIPGDVTCTPCKNKGMIFFDEHGKSYRFEQDGLNIWRSKFDHWLMKKSQEVGTVIYQGTTAFACTDKKDYVDVELRQNGNIINIQSKIAIICTGAISPIKNTLLNYKPKYTYTYQKFFHGTIDLDYQYFYAFLDKKFSGYDAWFNVKDDYIILGVADIDASNLYSYHSNFYNYMASNFNGKLTETEKSEKWVMPYVSPGCHVDLGKGNILFAGETAGFLNPMGEGISSGLASGYASAQSIAQAFSIGKKVDIFSLHEAYKENTKKILDYMIKQWAFVGNISTSFKNMKI